MNISGLFKLKHSQRNDHEFFFGFSSLVGLVLVSSFRFCLFLGKMEEKRLFRNKYTGLAC